MAVIHVYIFILFILSVGRERIMSMVIMRPTSLFVWEIGILERTFKGGNSMSTDVDYLVVVHLRRIANAKYSA